MPKQSTIQIHDAKNKGAMGYRVKFVGKNGEPLMNSEVLESVAAVNENMMAARFCGAGKYGIPEGWAVKYFYKDFFIEDHTTTQKFLRYGAKSGLKVKPKAKAKK